MIDKDQILMLMDESEAVYLATIGDKGPRIRALVNLRRADRYPEPSKICRAAGFTVYLATSRASDKIREISANPAVALYYCDPKTYHGVMLSGRAEVLDDAELKKALWSWDWRVYWPTGASDPDYVVVRIKADEVSGWWSGKEFNLEQGSA
jgi:general stress protein 26